MFTYYKPKLILECWKERSWIRLTKFITHGGWYKQLEVIARPLRIFAKIWLFMRWWWSTRKCTTLQSTSICQRSSTNRVWMINPYIENLVCISTISNFIVEKNNVFNTIVPMPTRGESKLAHDIVLRLVDSTRCCFAIVWWTWVESSFGGDEYFLFKWLQATIYKFLDKLFIQFYTLNMNTCSFR